MAEPGWGDYISQAHGAIAFERRNIVVCDNCVEGPYAVHGRSVQALSQSVSPVALRQVLSARRRGACY